MTTALLNEVGNVVCPRLSVADSVWTRMRGLLGRSSLEPGEGLLLRPAGSVHTAFMRFPIDVVFLDRHQRVLAITAGLRPWRMSGRRRARVVVELSAGEAARCGIELGTTLTVAPAAAT